MGESEMTIRAGHGAWMEESPYGIQSKKLGMWLFILADSATFGAILFAYGFLRVGSANWTTPFELWPTIVNGMVMTFVLLTSSLTTMGAVLAAQAGRKSWVVRWLGATVLLGILFMVLHLREWFKMFDEGWRLFQNPLGGPVQFGAAFFGLTGMHMLHVTVGVVYLSVIAWGFGRGRWSGDDVEVSGLYWHFVDIVWMFIFPMVYLMNAH